MVAQYFLSSNTAKLVVLMPPHPPSQKVLLNVYVCVCMCVRASVLCVHPCVGGCGCGRKDGSPISSLLKLLLLSCVDVHSRSPPVSYTHLTLPTRR